MSVAYPIPRETRRNDVVLTLGQTQATTTFLAYDTADIAVWKKATGDARFVRVTSGFTVSLVGTAPAAALVSRPPGLADGTILRIEGRRVPERTTDASLAGRIRSALLERDLDIIARTMQELRRDIDEAIADTLAAADAQGYRDEAQAAAASATSSAAAAAAALAALAGPILRFSVLTVANTPPGAPASGDRHLVDTAPTGAWATHAGKIARWDGAAWAFTTPFEGMQAYVSGTNTERKYEDGAWTTPAAAAAQGVLPFASRAALAAFAGATKEAAVIWNEGGRNGLFRWSSANNAASVTADPSQGVYVPPASDTTGASGAWVRIFDNKIFNVRWFGAVGDGATDDRAAIQAAIDLCGSFGVVFLPPGTYRINAGLTLVSSGQTLRGVGNLTSIIAANFATGNVLTIGNSVSPPENITVEDLHFSHPVTRTADSTLLIDHCFKTLVRNVRAHNCWTGLTLGSSGAFQAVNEAKFVNCYWSTMGNGATIWSPAGVRFEACDWSGYLSGSPSTPSPNHGVQIVGGADGIWFDPLCVVQTYNRGLLASHAAGSLASVEFHGKMGFCTTAHVSIECSGTAAINGFYLIDAEFTGLAAAGAEQGFFISETSSGSMSGIGADGCKFANIAQRVIYAASATSDLHISNCVSRNGGAAAANTYPGIDLGSAAHARVGVVNNLITGSHNYGLRNANNATVIRVVGNDFVGATGVNDNFGAASSSRLIRGNVGLTDAG